MRTPFSASAVQGFVEDTGGLQLDSINVLERAHYLSVWSRFGAYEKAALDRLAYEDRGLFEYWAHAACLVPRSHLPSWRRAMLDYRVRHTGWSDWLQKNPKVLKTVETAIERQGPISTAAFTRPTRAGRASGWWDWKPAAHALQFLWMTGRIGVHSRKNFQKSYDLSERLVPGWKDLKAPDAGGFLRWHLRQSLHALGAATPRDLACYLTFPRMEPGLRRAGLARLVETGEAVEVAVAGRPWGLIALKEDLPALEEAASLEPAGTTLLSPFDSFLWHRQRVLDLFAFDYKVEVYVPETKRVHGYYSLPILHAGQLIGRLDAKNHRAEKRLELRALHFEPWFSRGALPPSASWGKPDREEARAGLKAALRSLADFLGAATVDTGRLKL